MDRIANLYASLGFKIEDRHKLKRFERDLRNLERRVRTYADAADKSFDRIRRNTSRGFTEVENKLWKQRNQLHEIRKDYMNINREYKNGNMDYAERSRLLQDINRQYRSQRDLVRSTQRAVNNQPYRRLGQLLNTPIAGAGAGGAEYIRNEDGNLILIPRGKAAPKAISPHTAGTLAPKKEPTVQQRLTDAKSKVTPNMKAGAAGVGALGAGALGIATPAIAAAIAGGAAVASNESFQQVESIASAFVALEGSAEKAQQKLGQMAAFAEEYGQRFMVVADGYRSLANNLRGSAIEDQTMKIYRSLTAYSTALGLNQQDMAGIQLAIGQIAAAGRVQGDELMQLAERGISRNMLAEAMNLSLEEFVEKQQSTEGILAKDILPALADLMWKRANTGGALEQRKASTQAEQNRAANEALYSNILANTSGINNFFKELYKGFQEMFKEATPFFEEIGEAFESMAEPARNTAKSFGEVLGAFGNMSDALDGIDIDSPLPSLASILKSLSDWINDTADFIEVIRSDTSWQQKINGLGDLFVNKLTGIIEGFLNFAIDKLNGFLPEKWEIDRIELDRRDISARLPQVDLSGVNALMGNVNTEVTRFNKELQDKINKPNIPIKVPSLNEFGGLNDPNQLPFGMPMNRQGEAYNSTVNQDNTITINIDGAKQPDEILGTIEDHISNMMRNAASADTVQEK